MSNDPQIAARAAALAPLTQRVRTDATAIRLPEGGSRWRREQSLTPERLAAHLNGGPARGVCPIRAGESTTMVAVIDFDSHKGETSWDRMCIVAGQVFDSLSLVWGCEPLAFRSTGGRGIHVYVLWDTPQDAYSVRRWLVDDVLAGLGLRNGAGGVAAGQVEVFPKQDAVGVDGLGSQFILPLAGASEWLAFEELSGTLCGAAALGLGPLTAAAWRGSPGVPVRERPARAEGGALVAAGEGGMHLRTLRPAVEALAAALNEAGEQQGRDDWRNTVFGIHAAGVLDGDLAAAEALAERFSESTPGWDAAEFAKLWGSCVGERAAEGGIGPGTVLHLARARGWVDPERVPSADAFEVLPAVQAQRDAAGDGAGRRSEGGAGGMSGPLPGEPPLPDVGAVDEDGWPLFARSKKGEILPTLDNVVRAVGCEAFCGVRLAYDEFRDEVCLGVPGLDGAGRPGAVVWRPMRDSDLVQLRLTLEQRGLRGAPGADSGPVGKEMLRDAALLVAERAHFDSAILWLSRLERDVGWDGVPRIDGFLGAYLGCDDGGREGVGDGEAAARRQYVRAVSRYLWSVLAARVMRPGCKADMVPILRSAQGLRKTSFLEALAPSVETFCEVDFHAKEDDTARRLRGVLVAEIAELSGLRTREVEQVKKFITRRYEKWVPKFREFATVFPRRNLFVGTANEIELADPTGHRRWLPVEVGVCGPVDRAAMRRDRDQLWLEALATWRATVTQAERGEGEEGGEGELDGVLWRDAQRLAVEVGVHAAYEVGDSWAADVTAWLAGAADEGEELGGVGVAVAGGVSQIRGAGRFTISECLAGAIGLPVRDHSLPAQQRMGRVLRSLGYESHQTRVRGAALRWWAKAAG